jgi:DNA gyrase subunit A
VADKEEKESKKRSRIPTEPAKLVIDTTIENEMQSSYIDYAMSVIVGRALPDVRDGLKPVHRRILYGMDQLGVQPGKAYKKSARIVGEILGKYHPHGDTAVYDTLVRMAQDFSLRVPLVDGQGNFGSVDGDSPAAMRYTEARLTHAAVELLADLEKETVDFTPNFDESLEEPTVLPGKFPNLLVNGSSGIAVGMATNMAPHNLGEVVDGIQAVIENGEITSEELNKIIKGPDFPTGGLICGKTGIKDAFTTGRGVVTVRAKVTVEEMKNDKNAIIVHELPYQVNKASLIERIADLVKDKKVKGISDLRDESDRDGMRIYIETKRDVNPELILNQLYKHTDLQTTFAINNVVLVDGAPRLLNTKQIIEEYIKHREIVVTRRTKYELKKAEAEAHILEGLLIAVKNIDEVVKLIKKSKSVDEARQGLIKKFNVSHLQAQAILDLRLQKLTQLETFKIEEELKALLKLIAELKDLLASKKKILKLVGKELGEIKDKYADPRRTQITAPAEEVNEEELIADEEVAILITRDGYIKRMPINTFRSQQRGGRGVSGMATREEDQIDKIFVATTHNFLLFFTNKGKVYKVKIYEIPESSRVGKGLSIANYLELGMGEVATSAIAIKSFEQKGFLMMATVTGQIKKTELAEFANIRRTGIIAIKLKGEDELRWVKTCDGKQEVLVGTKDGLLIRFEEKNVRPMGRGAGGVRGISLRKGDKVISMDVIEGKPDLLMVSEGGFGKKMELEEFGVQNRGGKGHIAMKLREKDGVAGLLLVNKDDELLFVTSKGTMSRQMASGISTQGRYAKGVRIQRVDEGDYLVGVARVANKEEVVE